jgi:hypothetical protein
VIPFDTKPEIAAMQARILDSMSGEQRVLMAFEASHHVHELAKQRIRDEHPDWPEETITKQFLRSLFPPGRAPQGF